MSNLLKSKSFLPLFVTQFTSAFNDNIFKNALIILLTFNTAILPSWIGVTLAVNITAALLILPFFIFSAIAGQFADYYEKSRMIFRLKITELILMIAGMIGLATENIYLMWLVIFGLGTQAAFLGPLKYSIIPQLVKDTELTSGNALIESGTFLSILVGTILGGVLIEVEYGYVYLTIISVISALIGLISSWFIPKAYSSVTNGVVDFNIIRQTKDVIRIAKSNEAIFKSILAISWFWFLGAVLITEFPVMVRDQIGGSPTIVTIFLSLFSIGVIIGALITDKLSFGKVEIGLVPIGAAGIVMMLIDFTNTLEHYTYITESSTLSFLRSQGSIRLMVDLFLLSIFGGLFTVPLYAFLQESSETENRSRVISANNIINSLFMVAASIFIVLTITLTNDIQYVFWGLIILHFSITIYIFTVVPDFLARLMLWISIRPIVKFNISNRELIPEDEPALIICKKSRLLTPFFIFTAISRPIKFGINEETFKIMPRLFSTIGGFPVHYDDRFKETIDQANSWLNDGQIVLLALPLHFIHNKRYIEELNTIISSYTYPVLDLRVKVIKKNLITRVFNIELTNFTANTN